MGQWLLGRWQLPGEDENEDNIVDAKDDFEHAKREKGDRKFGGAGGRNLHCRTE